MAKITRNEGLATLMEASTMHEIDELIGRRAAERQDVRIQANLLTASRHQSVIVKDLSCSGAKLWLRRKIGSGRAMLALQGRKIWGEIVWQEDDWAGMQFDQQIDDFDR